MKTAEKTNGAVQGANQKKEEVNKATILRPNAPLKPQEKPNPEVKAESETKEAKPVPNLEQTLKVVENLHRRSIQRINLLSRIQQLDAFEIALLENGDELENNHFQGCQLIISDDKGRRFITQTFRPYYFGCRIYPQCLYGKTGRYRSQYCFSETLTLMVPAIAGARFKTLYTDYHVRAIYRIYRPDFLERLRRAIGRKQS